MITNYNSDLTKELVDSGKLQQSSQSIPTEFNDKISFVCDVNPRNARLCKILSSSPFKTASGILTNFTAPTDRDTFITSITAGILKSATCDIATATPIVVSITTDGLTRDIITFPSETLTAQNMIINQTFNPAIKIDRGSAITVSGTFAAGSLMRTCNVIGFQINNINA